MNQIDVLASVEALQKIIDIIPCPMFIKDSEFNMVFMNETMWSYSESPRGDNYHNTEFSRLTEEQKAVHKATDEKVMATGEVTEYEQYYITKDGNRKIGVIRKVRLILGPPPGTPFLVGILSDVTAYREAMVHSQHLSRHDTLTGLPNRMFFQERLAEAMAAGGRETDNVAILLLDLDGFKAVNDAHGHGAGDRLLCRMSNRLIKRVRAGDMVARLGGDEFGVLLCGGPMLREAAVRIAGELCEAVAKPVLIGDCESKISASIGIAHFSSPGTSSDELMRQADVAMYSVKRAGRDGVRQYAPELETVQV